MFIYFYTVRFRVYATNNRHIYSVQGVLKYIMAPVVSLKMRYDDRD
jgi:hypothetical protein